MNKANDPEIEGSEKQWLYSSEPASMLKSFREEPSARKLRLFSCACCRRIWDRIDNSTYRECVEMAESYEDGIVTLSDLIRTFFACAGPGNLASCAAKMTADCATGARITALNIAETCADVLTGERQELFSKAAPLPENLLDQDLWEGAKSIERKQQAKLLRDIFGNPFRRRLPRPEAIAPFAERIYAGEWELMPIFGEWLQEHGYWSEGEHCLDPKIQHVKGCWVVDWVTGRE